MKIFDSIFKEVLSSQVVSLLGGLIAGTLIAVYTDKLLLIPGILILLPGFLEMRGNISGSFSSRLSSGLFLGIIKPNKTTIKLLKGNLIASFLLALVVSLVLGFLAFLFNYFVFDVLMYEIISLALIAGIIANLIEIPITLFATFYVFKKGHDPNNIMIPFLTTIGDIVSVVSLLIGVIII
ncbi:magnesium transporter [Candidatus Pacearchaeota archaeon]|nr:magnesium transporter [Candidatus Pacearchaeota archaeon]